MKHLILFLAIILNSTIGFTQTIKGKVVDKATGKGIAYAVIATTQTKTISDSAGYFVFPTSAVKQTIAISSIGYYPVKISITSSDSVVFFLQPVPSNLEEVVVTGTLKEVRKSESPVPVEIFTPSFFKKNPSSCVFDALQNVNGVRPQLNCNICNTGDIHINGLEGPYTMVLIDGMPIVSSLSTVYGLSGIPNSLVERIEIVKGPASSLYGSEAIGGLINIITKNATTAPKLSADVMATFYQEYNVDLGFKQAVGKKAQLLTGINTYYYNHIVDENNDQFTDVTLQQRFSIFQKWNFSRKQNRVFNLAARYFTEDRWGGDVRWNKTFRGGDSLYAESIYTNRWELLGNYQLPITEKMILSFSYNNHTQDSRYGTTVFNAQQNIAFAQFTWDKKVRQHDLLFGTAVRYTFYDDNTTATANMNNHGNQPDKVVLPGVFVQDEISLNDNHKLLLGFRYDNNKIHGNIYTPRIAYKWTMNNNNSLRLNAGTGFRVVNLFTEDHAALTGARTVEIKDALKPEKSYNANLNYTHKIFTSTGTIINLDATAWYTYFTNRIIADYETDVNKIIYNNLNGFAESKGLSINTDIAFANGLKIIAGATFMNVDIVASKQRTQQLLTEKFTGTWAISYKIKKLNLAIDYTGNIYGPMRLPLLGSLDPRQPFSPTWSIQNIQFTYSGFKRFEIYGGVKNLLNWTPFKTNNPFLIARTNDPFDKDVQYNSNGQIIATANNPYALSFDPNYVYAPLQGLRVFAGVRYNLR